MIRSSIILVLFVAVTTIPLPSSDYKLVCNELIHYHHELKYEGIRATVYHAEPSQTDDTPFITADGSKIDTTNAHLHRWIAISRDLYSREGLRMGDTVWVESKDERIRGEWIVHDKMGKYYRDSKGNKIDQHSWIDFLSHRKKGIYGVWSNLKIYKRTSKNITICNLN